MADRWAKLTLTAHLRGSLPLRESHRYDKIWLLREKVILEEIERDSLVEIERMAHLWHCACAQTSGDDRSRFEFHRKWASKIYNSVGRKKMPWYKWQNDNVSLARMWKWFQELQKDPEHTRIVAAAEKELKARINRSVEFAAGEKLLREITGKPKRRRRR